LAVATLASPRRFAVRPEAAGPQFNFTFLPLLGKIRFLPPYFLFFPGDGCPFCFIANYKAGFGVFLISWWL